MLRLTSWLLCALCACESGDPAIGGISDVPARDVQVLPLPRACQQLEHGAPCGQESVCVEGECRKGCFTRGLFFEHLGQDPNGCAICDAFVSTVDLVTKPDGEVCPGGFCIGGTCGVGACVIDGEALANGVRHGTNPCLACDGHQSETSWTFRPDGSSCPQGGICANGACMQGCFIDGEVIVLGEHKPGSACQVCGNGYSDRWSNLREGLPCGTDTVCHQGECVPGCNFVNDYVPRGVFGCFECREGSTGVGYADDGTPCGEDSVCLDGSCGAKCIIDGTPYPNNARSPESECRVCDSSVSTDAFTNKYDGALCDPLGVCLDGECREGCYVARTFYSAGERYPSNPCQVCDPRATREALTGEPDGTDVCWEARTCIFGWCQSGCVIDDVVYYGHDNEPGELCRGCRPHLSTSEWSDYDDYSPCAPGRVCIDGECVPLP